MIPSIAMYHSTQFYSTHRWDPIATTTLSQSGLSSNGNECGTPHSLELEPCHQMFLVSYTGHLWVEQSYPSAEMQ